MTNQVPKAAIPNARWSLAHLSTGPLDHSALPLHIVICPPEPDLLKYLRFPWSGRPRDCLGGSICRTAVRYANPFNYCYLKLIDEPTDVSNGFGIRKRLRLRLRLRFGKRLRFRLRLRSRARFRSRRACRRRSRYSSRYVQTNSEFYFERSKEFSIYDFRLTTGERPDL
jgi:hypothetical protein